MTEFEILAGNAEGLKKLPGAACRDLANPPLAPFERLEARNQVDLYGAELRRHYQLMEAGRSHSRQQALNKNDGWQLPQTELRQAEAGLPGGCRTWTAGKREVKCAYSWPR
jgi:hypothetical protein